MAGGPGHCAPPTVSVIVPTHNRAAGLAEVVGPLLDDEAATEVLVVVDGSRDGSLGLLERMAVADDRLRPLFVEHGGKQAACEAALDLATGEVVLLVDDDVVARPGLVSGHARHHGAGSGLVVVGYMPAPLPARRRPGDAPAFLYAAEYEEHCSQIEVNPDLILLGLWGGNVSLRRSDCEAVGLDSPDFPDLYHEDQDFGIRCLEAGLRGVFDRSLAATHLHRRSAAAFLADARSQGAGQWLVHRLHPDVLGSFDLGSFEVELPPPVRAVLRASRRPRISALSKTMLLAAATAAGAVHAFGVETAALRLDRRIEQQAGALQMARGAGAHELSRHALVGESEGGSSP